jgi:transposase-like protein
MNSYSPKNVFAMFEAFDTDAECRAYLEELRWPDGVKCPRCESEKISRLKERKQFDCDGCHYQFSVTAGTIFHDSHLGLPKWFFAILLLCEAKKSMSALQLKRTMGVSYKTAWYMCHRIREAMKDPNALPLTGTVEVDETYLGGRTKGLGGGRGKNMRNKKMILGALQRGGQIRMSRGAWPNKKTLHKFVHETVSPNAHAVYTDGNSAYFGVGKDKYPHETVEHARGEYVRGNVHTNTVESAFGLFKRAIVGSFHQVSEKHLDRYLDEFEFRYNNRKNRFLFRDTVLRLISAEKMPYSKLTA